MIIRTFVPDYAYLPEVFQGDADELIGVHVELRGEEVDCLVRNDPYGLASALEGIAEAIRRKWLI